MARTGIRRQASEAYRVATTGAYSAFWDVKHGCAIVRRVKDGSEAFLQGDEAWSLLDDTAAIDSEAVLDAVLSAYDDVMLPGYGEE